MYGRSLCGHVGVTQEPGYLKFDPSDDEGRMLSRQPWRLLIVYFKIPASRSCQRKRFKDTYMDFKQGKMAMRQFISMDDRLFSDFLRALGDMSDQSKIEIMSSKLSSQAINDNRCAEIQRHPSDIGDSG